MSEQGQAGQGDQAQQAAPAPAQNGWATAETVIQDVLTVGETIASLLPPGAAVVNAIQLAVQIGNGLANAVPSIQSTWDEIQQVASSGNPPTQEQWTAWNAAADQAHQDFVAAVAAAKAAA